MSETRSRRRVALVAHDIHDEGGMERAFAELLRRTKERYEFTVYASTLAPDLRPFVRWERIRIPARPFPLKFGLFFLIAGFRLRHTRAEIVHTLGAIVPNRAQTATIQFCHAGYVEKTGGLSPDGARPLRRLNSALSRLFALGAERWCYRRSRLQVLAAVSTGVETELAVHYPAIPSVLTPNGLDTDRYRPDAETRARLRSDESVADDGIICLFVGGDWDRKGLGIVMEALALLEGQAKRRVSLWVVGRGDEARYQQMANELGLAGDIRFFGARRDTERFYQAADIFVFPTEYESFSLVAYEAAASGLPVIATRVSGIEDLIIDERSGFLIDRSSAAIAASLDKLVADPELRLQMGEEGTRRASPYTWQRSVDSVVRLYEGLLANGEDGAR